MTLHQRFPMRHSRLLVGLSAALALVAASIFPASPAFAHEGLVSGTPEQGSTLQGAPAQMKLEFTGPLQEMEISASNQIEVVDENGQSVVKGETKVDEQYLIADLEITTNGTYAVSWRALSGDGHPVANEGPYTFNVNDPALEAASASSAAPTPEPSANNSKVSAETDTTERTEASSLAADHSFWSPGLIGLTIVVLLSVSVSGFFLARQRRNTQNPRGKK